MYVDVNIELYSGPLCRIIWDLITGVICLYRYFVIFLLVLICFPTAKSFLQRIFTPKKNFGPSGKKILHFFLKTRANPTFFT